MKLTVGTKAFTKHLVESEVQNMRANREVREFEEARHNYLLALEINYQLALEIKIEFSDRYGCAVTYHELGRVAREVREFEEAWHNYLLALEIKIEFSDRYNQAKPYYQLGQVVEELGELEKAKINYLQALKIWAEFDDEYSLEEFSIPSIAHLYQTTRDESLLAAAAPILGVTVKELKEAIGENPQ